MKLKDQNENQAKKIEDFLCDGLSNTRRGTPKTTTCIDYFKFRVDGNIELPKTEEEYRYDENGYFEFIRELCKILLLDIFKRVDEPVGFLKYRFFSTFDEDVTIYGGRASEATEDGITRSYVEIKGHGLRMFELRCLESDVDVFEQYCKLFEFCYKYSVHFERNLKMLRIDTTLDDFSNLIKIVDIQEKLRKGYYVSNCRTTRFNLDYEKDTNNFYDNDKIIEMSKNDGWTFYIGGRTSRQLCIYDKKAEREEKGNSVIADSWVRYEGRFYQQNAQAAFLSLYINVFKYKVTDRFSNCICELIGKIIEFKEDNTSDSSHQYRERTWSKWNELLNGAKVGKFNIQADLEKDISFKKSKNWLINSPYMNITLEFLVEVKFDYNNELIKLTSNSLPKLYDALGLYFDDKFLMFILQLLIKGKKKLDFKKLAIVNNMRFVKGYPKINTVSDAEKLIDDYVDGRGSFNLDYEDDGDEEYESV